MLKAIIDCNIWVSGLMKSTLSKPILDAFERNEFQSVVSSALLREIEGTLSQPRIMKRIDGSVANEMLALIAAKSIRYDPIVKLKICRDPKDDFLLSMSFELDVPVVSLDKDLIVLAGKFDILRPRDFMKLLAKEN